MHGSHQDIGGKGIHQGMRKVDDPHGSEGQRQSDRNNVEDSPNGQPVGQRADHRLTSG